MPIRLNEATMTEKPADRHYVRRVVLPSGKTIEVVYFHDAADQSTAVKAPAEQAEHQTDTVHDLHVCGHCDAPLVYPVEWEEAGPEHWEVELRCPNCEWTGAGIFHQEIVERFDEELDRGTEHLVRDLKRLMHANMEDEIERFVAALEADQVLPEDF